MERHNHDDDNILHFYDDEWDCDHSCDCDGDSEDCDHPPHLISPVLTPIDMMLHELIRLRFDILSRNAYDLGLMSKDDYIDILGHSLAEYDGEEDCEC